MPTPFMFEYGIAVNDANETLVVGWGYQDVSGSPRAIGLCLCHNPDGTLKWTRRFKGEISTVQTNQVLLDSKFMPNLQHFLMETGQYHLVMTISTPHQSTLDNLLILKPVNPFKMVPGRNC